MYCAYCKQKNNVVSGIYGKSEYTACEKCSDTIGSEEQQQFTESMLETLGFSTLNLEVFKHLTHVPSKLRELYPKYMPLFETANVVDVDMVPSLFQTYNEFEVLL